MNFFIFFLFLSTFFWTSPLLAVTRLSERGDREIVEFLDKPLVATPSDLDRENFFDPKADYSLFAVRVTDRDETMSILRVQSQEKNIKFFRVGDQLEFRVGEGRQRSRGICQGHIRDVEGDYLVIYVHDLNQCWRHNEEYFRRGKILSLHSEILQQRILEASRYRQLLLQRREDFFSQLNQINHFLWTFDQQKVLVAAEYDEQIARLQRQKEEALGALLTRKKDQALLQRELVKRLDQLDEDLEFYRIEAQHEYNRWKKDHHSGLPLTDRPQESRPDTRSIHLRNL